MSGGTFDHKQWQITNIADEIEQLIVNNGAKRESRKDWEDEYETTYPPDIIAEFKTAVKYLKLAYMYTQRIDWLVAGDDGEDSFRKRLKKELNKLNEV